MGEEKTSFRGRMGHYNNSVCSGSVLLFSTVNYVTKPRHLLKGSTFKCISIETYGREA